MWHRVGLCRPVVVRSKKDLPVMEIKNNLRTLGLSNEVWFQFIETLE